MAERSLLLILTVSSLFIFKAGSRKWLGCLDQQVYQKYEFCVWVFAVRAAVYKLLVLDLVLIHDIEFAYIVFNTANCRSFSASQSGHIRSLAHNVTPDLISRHYEHISKGIVHANFFCNNHVYL